MKPKKIKKTNQTDEEAKLKEIEELHNFYNIDIDKSTGKFKGIYLDKKLFIEKLKSFGFAIFEQSSGATIFIQIKDNIIKEVTELNILDTMHIYIKKLPDRTLELPDEKADIVITSDMIERKYLDSLDKFSGIKFLSRMMGKENINFVKDTKTEKYFFYRNGFIKITADDIVFLPYDKLKGYIWQEQKLERDYIADDKQESIFEKFFTRITSDELKRKHSLKTITGYLLHNYIEMRLIGILITDSKYSPEGKPEGRSGKSLWAKAISWMLNARAKNDKFNIYCEVGGKSFTIENERKYQKAGPNTQVININDVFKFFSIEDLFTEIEDGIEVRRLYQLPFTIYPKMVITTNKTIKTEGGSARARFKYFQLSDYFDENRTPDKEYGCWFFRDWDDWEWGRFDNFMIGCVREYLKHGLVIAPNINLELRMVTEHTNPVFIDFMNMKFMRRDQEGNVNSRCIDIVENPGSIDEIKLKRIDKQKLYEEYVELNKEDNRRGGTIGKATFIKWVKAYTEAQGEYNVIDNKQPSNGIYYIYWTKK